MVISGFQKFLVGAAIFGGGYYLAPPRLLWEYGIKVRYPMEDFIVDASGGSQLSSSDCIGRPVLLMTWGAWCPYMPGNLAEIEKLKARFAYSDICVVPVSTDEKAAKAWEFARANNMAEPNYWGYKGMSDMFWGYGVPHLFLFDRKRRLKLHGQMTELDHEALMAAIVGAIEDGTPRNTSPSPTRPGQAGLVDEEKREADELAVESARLFQAGRLDDLDARAAFWRKGRERTLLDAWKEATVYSAITVDSDDEAADSDHEARIRLFEAWSATRPASVTARLALGRQWYKYAWKARGHGYASETTEEGARLFRERLEKARVLFEETALMPDTSPVVYRELLGLARSQGWDGAKTDDLLRRAVAFEPDYLEYYDTRATTLLPRWGGSDEEVAHFAAASADARKDGRGDELYARILWSLAWAYEGEKRSPFDAGFSWPRVRAGLGQLLARRPQSTAWLSRGAKLALAAGDKETARKMFTALGGRCDQSVWPVYRDYWNARAGVME